MPFRSRKGEPGEGGRWGAPQRRIIEDYVTATARNLPLEFLKGLSGPDKAEAISLLELQRECGNTLGMAHSRPLGGGLFELRGHQVRLFYTFRPGRRIVLLDGIIQRRGDIPPAVLARVRRLLAAVQARAAKAGGSSGTPERSGVRCDEETKDCGATHHAARGDAVG